MKLELLSVCLLVLVLGYTQAFADTNTISKYCSNGICNTGPSLTIPANYTLSTKHLPILFVDYSQGCENMIKNHITGCPPLSTMVPYDTSNQNISGHFIIKDNQTIRSSPEVKTHWNWYKYSTKTIVCIECVSDIQSSEQSQHVIIEPTSYSFADKNPDHVITKQISYTNDRFMQGCDIATISNIPGLLNDTIKYMLSGCTQTNFNGNVTKSIHDTAWQYDNQFSTLHHDTFLKNIMHGHYIFGNMTNGGIGPGLCINGKTCDFTDPYKKQGY